MLKTTFPILSLALLSGCSLAPKYERPAAPVAAEYPNASAGTAAASAKPASELSWQEFFGDARLQRLIGLALENNRDLRVAALNVERVRALYNIQRTALIPSVNATGSGTRKRTPADLSSSGQAVTSNSFSAGLEVPSYEVDFFGRVVSLKDQVLQQYLATEEARLSAQIGLVSSVARQYLTLLATEEQLSLAQNSFEAADRSFKLNKQTYDAGLSSELDLRTAEGQRETYRASLASLDQQKAQALNALVLLVGAPLPADLPAPGTLATQKLIDDLPAGLPSELLARRPDIRQAEHTLQSSNAYIGVARAAFFPSVKLTAFGGTASSELSGLFDKGSGSWSFAPSVSLPLFAAGKNVAQLKAAWIEQRIDVAGYEKAIQTAFREVSDALAVKATIDTQISAQGIRVDAARKRYELTDQGYKAGLNSYIDVLLAQQELNAAQQSLIAARLSRLLNLTTLYAALGGGWQNDPGVVQTKKG